jgi:hypothetical protein
MLMVFWSGLEETILFVAPLGVSFRVKLILCSVSQKST